MAKARYDARELMQRAIRVMRDSVNERRVDGKASPLVGAVLWRPDVAICPDPEHVQRIKG